MWGTILQYIVSYFRIEYNPTLTIDQSVVVFQIMVQLFTIFVPIGAILIRKFPYPFYYCSAYGLCYGGAVILSSYVQNFWIFIFTYGFISGALHGTQYILPMLCGQLYFPKRKALISGCVMAGIGLGTLSFNLLFFNIVNPHNLSPKALPNSTSHSKYFYGDSISVAQKVPEGLRVLAVCWMALGILAGILINFPKYYKEKKCNKYKCNTNPIDLEHAELHIDLDPYFLMKVMDIGFELDIIHEQKPLHGSDDSNSGGRHPKVYGPNSDHVSTMLDKHSHNNIPPGCGSNNNHLGDIQNNGDIRNNGDVNNNGYASNNGDDINHVENNHDENSNLNGVSSPDRKNPHGLTLKVNSNYLQVPGVGEHLSGDINQNTHSPISNQDIYLSHHFPDNYEMGQIAEESPTNLIKRMKSKRHQTEQEIPNHSAGNDAQSVSGNNSDHVEQKIGTPKATHDRPQLHCVSLNMDNYDNGESSQHLISYNLLSEKKLIRCRPTAPRIEIN